MKLLFFIAKEKKLMAAEIFLSFGNQNFDYQPNLDPSSKPL
jgi:hypothetical protein